MSKEIEDIKKQAERPLPAKPSLLEIADNDLRLAHEKIKKLEETMKLIVKKAVNMHWFIVYSNVEHYNISVSKARNLTETEFNQIKEMIEKYGK